MHKLRRLLKFLPNSKKPLEAGQNARSVKAEDDELELVKDLSLLTIKPVIYVANVEEDAIHTGNSYVEVLKEAVKYEDAQVIMVSASIESQIAELEDDEEKEMFLDEYGLKESGLSKLIKASYALLDLITYFYSWRTRGKSMDHQERL